jgi:hypothetical protein
VCSARFCFLNIANRISEPAEILTFRACDSDRLSVPLEPRRNETWPKDKAVAASRSGVAENIRTSRIGHALAKKE